MPSARSPASASPWNRSDSAATYVADILFIPVDKGLTAGAGLRRFLSSPDFALTPEQFRASMEVDFFEQ
jgi:hypothetical protein